MKKSIVSIKKVDSETNKQWLLLNVAQESQMVFITKTIFSVLRYFLSVQDVKASHMKYHVAFTRFTHFSACFYLNLLTFHEERGFFLPLARTT